MGLGDELSPEEKDIIREHFKGLAKGRPCATCGSEKPRLLMPTFAVPAAERPGQLSTIKVMEVIPGICPDCYGIIFFSKTAILAQFERRPHEEKAASS